MRNFSLKQYKIKNKLIFIHLLPLIGLGLLSIHTLWDKSLILNDTEVLHKELSVVQQLGKVLDAVQAEQQLAIEYLNNPSTETNIQLSKHISRTRQAREELLSLAQKSGFSEHLKQPDDPLKLALNKLSQSFLIRQSVLSKKVTVDEIFQIFEQISSALIEALIDTRRDHFSAKLIRSFPSNYLDSYIHLVRLQLNANREHYYFNKALTENRISVSDKNSLIALKTQQKELENDFFHHSYKKARLGYESLNQNAAIKELNQAVEHVLTANFIGGFRASLSEWNKVNRQKIEILEDLEHEVFSFFNPETEELETIIENIRNIEFLVHELQKERELAIDFYVNKNQSSQSLYLTQANNTDQFLKQYFDKTFKGLSGDTLQFVQQQLAELRTLPQNIESSLINAITGYSQINARLFRSIKQFIHEAQKSSCFKCLFSYFSLLNIKENAAVEKVLLSLTFNKKHFVQGTKDLFIEAITKQNSYLEVFMLNANQAVMSHYHDTIQDPVFEEVKMMRQAAFESTDIGGFDINPSRWKELSEIKRTLLSQLIDDNAYQLKNANQSYSRQRIQEIYIIVIIYIILVALIVISYSTVGKQIFENVARLGLLEIQFLELMKNHDINRKTDFKYEDEIEKLITIFSHYLNYLDDILKEDEKILQEINKAADKIKHQDFSYQIEGQTPNQSLERGRLKLNEIMADFHQLFNQLQDEVQKNKEKDLLLLEHSKLTALGEMIGNIAHQWRQPLNALGLTLQKLNLLSEHGKLDPEQLNTNVQKSMLLIEQMSATINDFRDFFKPEKNKQLFSINDAILQILKLIKASTKKHNIEITCHFDEKIEINCFKNELAQVLISIITNAKEKIIANNIDKGLISINVEKKAHNVRITIIDNAGGIPKAIKSRIFEPYFSTKEEGKGSGLGLYMARTIIINHMNGEMTAKNVDDGACFSIEFPTSIRTEFDSSPRPEIGNKLGIES